MASERDPAEAFVARDASYYRAPDSLRQSVRAALARQARASASSLRWRWVFGGAAAAFAATVAITWNVAMLQARQVGAERLAQDITTAHVRSLLVEGRLDDIVSSDRHTVKPWFQGRLDYAPPVVDLAPAGYPLTGGRLDYVDGRTVAALTYRIRLHVVNVFVWPSPGEDVRPALTPRNGYSLVGWRHGGMAYWAVSDAASAELLQFANVAMDQR